MFRVFFKVIPLKPLQIQMPIISSMETDQMKSQRQISPSGKLITIAVFAPYCRAYRASLVIPLFTYLWTFEIICDLAKNKYYYCTAEESIINLQDENDRLQEQILLVWLAQMEPVWLSCVRMCAEKACLSFRDHKYTGNCLWLYRYDSQSSIVLYIEVLYIWSILLPLNRISSLIWFYFILLHVPLKKERPLATGTTCSQVTYSGASSWYLHVFPQISNSSHLWNSFLTQLKYNWCIFPRAVMYALGKTMNRTILYR